MGFRPRDVDEMSVWEFTACVDGYAEANGGKKRSGGGDISEERLAELGIVGFT